MGGLCFKSDIRGKVASKLGECSTKVSNLEKLNFEL